MSEAIERVRERIAALEQEIAEVEDALERSREYLAQAAYAHERGWPCPRCGKPMDGYAEGDHPCLAIERINAVDARRRLSVLYAEREELRAIEREIQEGVVYETHPLPLMVLKEVR